MSIQLPWLTIWQSGHVYTDGCTIHTIQHCNHLYSVVHIRYKTRLGAEACTAKGLSWRLRYARSLGYNGHFITGSRSGECSEDVRDATFSFTKCL